jgi:hydrogenase-4 component E
MNLIYPLTHLMGGIMLLCAFSLLSQRRLSAMITLYQVQALTLAAAAFWQGFAQSDTELYLTGLITLAIKGLLLPMGLRQIVQRFNLVRSVETALPVGLSMILGVGLIGVAVLVVLPTTLNAISLTREDLAISLSILLLGFLVMTTRRNALAHVIGFLSSENGLVLAATGMPGMPFVAELSVALLVLLAFLVVGVFLLRIREHFDTLDLSGIEDIERQGR